MKLVDYVKTMKWEMEIYKNILAATEGKNSSFHTGYIKGAIEGITKIASHDPELELDEYNALCNYNFLLWEEINNE